MSLTVTNRSNCERPVIFEPRNSGKFEELDFSSASCSSLFIKVYEKGVDCLKSAFSKNSSYSLCNRVSLAFAGLLLLIPVINTVVYLILHCFMPKPSIKESVSISSVTKLPETAAKKITESTQVTQEKVVTDKEKRLLERSLPPLTDADTIILKNGAISSKYGDLTVFDDDEIVQIIDNVREEEAYRFPGGRPLYVKFAKGGVPLFQQQNRRGSAAAATAMLVYEHEKRPEFLKLKLKKGTGHIVNDIKKAGLTPLTGQFHKNQSKTEMLKQLDECIRQQGPAILQIGIGKIEHTIVVDKITLNSAFVRCPYHFWKIEIKLSALEKRMQGREFIQIQEKIRED